MITGIKKIVESLFFSGAKGINNLEKALFEELEKQLPPELATSLRKQIMGIIHVERLFGCKSCYISLSPKIKTELQNDDLFPVQNRLIARAKISIADQSFKVSFGVHQGFLSSLEFSKPMKDYIKCEKMVFDSLELLIDDDKSALESCLPDDYELALSSYEKSKLINVLEEEEIRIVNLERGLFYVIAELPNAYYFVVSEDDSSGEIFLVGHDEDDGISFGESLIGAIEKLKNSSKKEKAW